MRTTLAARLAAIVPAALALLVVLPAPGDEGEQQMQAPDSSAATARGPDSPTATAAPIANEQAARAQAAWEAMQERKAALTAELNRRYEEIQSEAAKEGIEPLPAPPWPQEPKWLSYQEMRELMSQQGVPMPPMPTWGQEHAATSADQTPAAETQNPAAGPIGPEALRHYFSVIEQMSPEQQEACFAVARWQAAMMSPRMPPAAVPHQGGPLPPAFGPQPVLPFPGMTRPGH